MIDGLRRGPADRAVCAGGVGERVGVDCKFRGHAQVGHHVGVGTRRGQHAVTPLDEVMVGVRHCGHRQTVGTVIDRLRRSAADRPIGAGGIGQRVGVDCELRRRVHVRHHVGIGAGRRQHTVTPLHEVVVGVRDRSDRRSVCTVLHGLRRGAADRAIGVGEVAQRVGVDRKLCNHTQVGHHVGIGPRGRQHTITPLHEVVVGVRDRGDRRSVCAVIDGLRRDPADRAIGAGGVAQRVGVDREFRDDAQVGHHVGVGPRRGQHAIAPLHEVMVRVGYRGDR